MRMTRLLSIPCALLVMSASSEAQTAAVDPSVRLREVLPQDVADRVLARIANARARELPTAALEHRALKFVARGVTPVEIERQVVEHVDRLERSRAALNEARPETDAAGEEIAAGAEAMRQGADAEAIVAVAKAARDGRSLEVPLLVLGSLLGRELPSDEALARVVAEMQARASDEQLERLAGEAGARGRAIVDERRPAAGVGPGARPPITVPSNPGSRRPPTGGPPTGRP